MGEIRVDVLDNHLNQHPAEERLLRPMLQSFSITWGRRRTVYNATLSVYFLLPMPYMSETFGFERELLLAISPHPTLQPRTMQAIESILNDEPASGRVDQSMFLLYSEAADGQKWVNGYLRDNPQSRIPILITQSDLEKCGSDQWAMRNAIARALHIRDLFDYTLPIKSDIFFFGRRDFVTDLLDAVRDSKNRGLFGLRKTGKTSMLERIRRISEKDKNFKTLYYDCKRDYIRQSSYKDLIVRLINDIQNIYPASKKVKKKNSQTVSEHFFGVISSIPARTPLCIIFDEIEYISWFSQTDLHWRLEFVPFWQILWSAQSEYRKLSYIVSGVNALCVETDLIGGVQNPMFGIFPARYIKGLSTEDTGQMIRLFGRRMGLRFEDSAVDLIFANYGGHPLLTRMACSFHHKEAAAAGKNRPLQVSENDIRLAAADRDHELRYYCRHIVSEIKEFYPTEYELIKMLAEGHVNDFIEFRDAEPEFTRHAAAYGLLREAVKGARPGFAIPVVGQYISQEIARERRAPIARQAVAAAERGKWIRRRCEHILERVRELDKVIGQRGLPELYGNNSFPNAERFMAIREVGDRDSLENFLNTMYQCFVEPVDSAGRRQKSNDYFWKAVPAAYPALSEALARARVYRHKFFHRELNVNVDARYQGFVEKDFAGRVPWELIDGYFLVQQVVLEELLVSVHLELERYT